MKRLLKFTLIVGAVGAAVKILGAQRDEFRGLTESEARAKVQARIPDRVPADKKAAVTDKVVSAMRDRGVLREDAPPSPASDAAAVGGAAGEQSPADTPTPSSGEPRESAPEDDTTD